MMPEFLLIVVGACFGSAVTLSYSLWMLNDLKKDLIELSDLYDLHKSLMKTDIANLKMALLKNSPDALKETIAVYEQENKYLRQRLAKFDVKERDSKGKFLKRVNN